MKFMEKAKRFFTLSAKHEGFTLVELIVVIAILAILAGVAIPAYSGYINKAKEAGDQTLLAAVNKAFAAACMVEGVDAVRVVQEGYEFPRIKVDGGKVNYVAPGEMKDHFDEFFAGNENSTFEVIGDLEFNPAKGVFEDAAKAEGATVSFNGKDFSISNNIINAFRGSVFGKDAETVGAMKNQLTGISETFGSLPGASNITDGFATFMEENKDMNVGNAAVLYVAQNAGNYSAQDIANMFDRCEKYITDNYDHENNKAPAMGNILNNAFADDQDALTSAALMYGAVTAYANSDKCTNEDLKNTVANVQNGDELVNVFLGLQTDAGWKNYIGTADIDESGNKNTIASDQFTTDMNGFLGAMDALNTVSPEIRNIETEGSVLLNTGNQL